MYILKPEMAQELKQTTSQIYTDAPDILFDSKSVATIGDICTVKLIQEEIIPNLMIVDYKTKRNVKLTEEQISIIESVKCKSVEVDNEAGTISQQLYDRLYFSITTGTLLGYGDIVPITNTSKLLSMIQSICTIALILA